MNTHAGKARENKRAAVANSLPGRENNREAAFQFVVSLPEIITQKKLQETANNSFRVKQLRAYQAMADHRSQPIAGQVDNIIQRKVEADSFKELLEEQQKTTETLTVAGLGQNVKFGLKGVLYPPLSEEKQGTLLKLAQTKALPLKDLQQLQYYMSVYAEEHVHPGNEDGFAEYIWPNFLTWLEGKISKKHTTVGFEFEFASMEAGNPFSGVTHVELTKSKEKYNGLPFILETDAGNALELVGPPFWVEAIDNDTPIPKVEDVRKIQQIIKTRLEKMVSGDLTMDQLTKEFKTDPDLTFDLKDAKVTPKNLSDRSIGKFTREKDTVASGDVGNIKVGKITKYGHGGIDTQVNLATDAATYGAVEALNIRSREKNPYVRQFYDLQDYLEDTIGIRNFKGPLYDFLKLFTRNIAGQLAIPSMNYIQAMQKTAFETGKTKEKERSDLEFDFYAWSSSGVKDVGNVWIKDNIINIGMGMLSIEDWNIVLEIAQGKPVHGAIDKYKVPQYLTHNVSDKLIASAVSGVIRENEKKVGAYYADAKKYMHGAVDTMASAIKGLKLDKELSKDILTTPEIGFMSHDPKFISPRQDTHVDSGKVQLPAWKQRLLHIVELRSDPVETLDLLIKKVMKDRAQQIERQRAEEEWEKNAKPFQRANRITKEIMEGLFTKNRWKQFIIHDKFAESVGLDEGTYKKYARRAEKIPAKEVESVWSELEDLAWGSEKDKHLVIIFATHEKFSKYD